VSGDGEQVLGADPGREQRLVRVAERRVGDRDGRLCAQPAGELLGAELEQQLAAAVRGGDVEVDRRQLGGGVDAHGCRAVRLVDGHVSEEREQLAAAVALATCRHQLRVGLDERRGDVAAGEIGILEHRLQERDVRGDPADPELRDGATGLLDGLLEGPSATGELGEHRVEVRGHLGAGVDRAAVDAHAGAARRAVGRDLAGVRAEAVGGVLGGDPALERGAAQHHVVLGETEVLECLAGGDPQLRLHEVDVGDLLGHRVLDLDPGVHLDEDVVALGVEQELDGAGVAVADLGREAHRVGAHPLPDPGVEVGRRGDLDDLLVAALDRAVALEEVDHVAGTVGEDLYLDVAGVHDRLLDEDGRVAERALALAHAGLDGLAEVLGGVDPTHPAPAAARHGLHEQRVGQGGGRLDELVDVGGRRHRRQRRYPGLLGGRDGAGLVAGQREHVGGRPDEGDPGVGTGLGQGRVLRQEAIARVDGVGAGPQCDGDDRVGVEVGAHRVAALPDLVGLVGLEAVLGPPVLVGEDRHGLRAHLVGRPERTDRDLATVGDQHLGEHGHTL
jgi:hypothetical protein